MLRDQKPDIKQNITNRKDKQTSPRNRTVFTKTDAYVDQSISSEFQDRMKERILKGLEEVIAVDYDKTSVVKYDLKNNGNHNDIPSTCAVIDDDKSLFSVSIPVLSQFDCESLDYESVYYDSSSDYSESFESEISCFSTRKTKSESDVFSGKFLVKLNKNYSKENFTSRYRKITFNNYEDNQKSNFKKSFSALYRCKTRSDIKNIGDLSKKLAHKKKTSNSLIFDKVKHHISKSNAGKTNLTNIDKSVMPSCSNYNDFKLSNPWTDENNSDTDLSLNFIKANKLVKKKQCDKISKKNNKDKYFISNASEKSFEKSKKILLPNINCIGLKSSYHSFDIKERVEIVSGDNKKKGTQEKQTNTETFTDIVQIDEETNNKENNNKDVENEKRADDDDEDCGSGWGYWLEYLMVLLVAFILLLGCVFLVLFWCFYYRKGYNSWKVDNDQQFNLHPTLMVGAVVFTGFSVLMYRIGRCSRRLYVKLLHATFHLLAILCFVGGFLSIFEYHNMTSLPHFYSLHSWVGFITMGLFGVQFLVGFVSFLVLLCCESATAGFRACLLPLHTTFGLTIFLVSIATCLTGIVQRTNATIGSTDYPSLPEEAIVINALGVALVAVGVAVTYALGRTSLRVKSDCYVSERL